MGQELLVARFQTAYRGLQGSAAANDECEYAVCSARGGLGSVRVVLLEVKSTSGGYAVVVKFIPAGLTLWY